jgi:prepilin-type N-terminal cleavage/methylation domain-containing protein
MLLSGQKAFTLLELLVVITIIGVLSSIVVVSMSGSTDSATIAKGKAYAQQVHALLGHEAAGIWDFDEGAQDTCPGSKDVCDSSGYNNHGVISGASYISSDIDKYALSFNGTNYVKIDGIVVTNPSSLTISSWFKKQGAGDNYECVLHQSSDTSIGNSSYWMGVDLDDYLTATIGARTGVGWSAGQTGIKAVLGEWNHLIATWDGSVVRVYINGEYIKQYFLATYSNLTTPTRIGASSDGANYRFNGIVDEVRIYRSALPATEIQKSYVQGLEKLLANQAITQAEYDQRMEEFNQSLVLYE